MEQSFLDYSMSVIASRALPDVRDGLKPVLADPLGNVRPGARPDRPTVKCARVVGEVMGRYHPHGDGAIYDALVRMGQRFSMRHQLIDPKGNFGSPSDEPAAMRYTGAGCPASPCSCWRASTRTRSTSSTTSTGSTRNRSPSPTLPNLLVNGSQGIAVGMAANIPYNLSEVVGAVNFIANEATAQDLMEFVKGPDFPTGGLIMGRQGIIDVHHGPGLGAHPRRCRDRRGQPGQPDRRHRDPVPDERRADRAEDRRPHREAPARRHPRDPQRSRPRAPPPWSSS